MRAIDRAIARGAGAAPARDRDGATMPTTTMPTTTRAMTMRATMRATRATRAVRARCATGRARDARVSAQMGPELRESIDAFVAEHRVVLFMKGTKDAPRCGFSNTCVQILNSMNVPFADVDILANEDLRQGMKCVGARRRERERERTTSRTTAR
jgi:monothiol glutaredoxin